MGAPMGSWIARPITGTFGAEIQGGRIDGTHDAGWLSAMLAEHLVLIAREQHLTPSEHVALALSLGEPTPAHPVVPGHPDHPEILVLDGAAGGKNARWHTDVTFLVSPPAASILVALQVPDTGGDTCWVDLRSAYQRLAEPLRQLADRLDAVHRITPLAYWGEPADSALTRDDAIDLSRRAAEVPPVIHPVVRLHPVTGRPALFVNPGFTSHIVGLSRIESDGLLDLLHRHTTQPELMMRHRWRTGDVVIWDNRATMHYAVDDYGAGERLMHRVTIAGGPALGPNGTESHVADDPLIALR